MYDSLDLGTRPAGALDTARVFAASFDGLQSFTFSPAHLTQLPQCPSLKKLKVVETKMEREYLRYGASRSSGVSVHERISQQLLDSIHTLPSLETLIFSCTGLSWSAEIAHLLPPTLKTLSFEDCFYLDGPANFLYPFFSALPGNLPSDTKLERLNMYPKPIVYEPYEDAYQSRGILVTCESRLKI